MSSVGVPARHGTRRPGSLLPKDTVMPDGYSILRTRTPPCFRYGLAIGVTLAALALGAACGGERKTEAKVTATVARPRIVEVSTARTTTTAAPVTQLAPPTVTVTPCATGTPADGDHAQVHGGEDACRAPDAGR